LPATDTEGKILMKERLNLLMTPDGNGGVYEAIEKAGLIQEWKNKGIDYVHFMGIDNLLARPAEPILLGMAKGIKGEL
jgi:UDP-N-acetylglucosamine pyrophosphorylase